MKIGIIGLGNMGTAVANNIAGNGHTVMGWEYFKEVVEEINTRHTNSRYLQGVMLSANLAATTDLSEATGDKDAIFVALPSVFIRKVLMEYRDIGPQCIVVSLSKGVEEDTCYTTSLILKEMFPNNKVVVLSGPSIANEFSKGLPCGVMLAGEEKEVLYKIAGLVETPTFRTRFTDDVVGVEWSGIFKNIYAIGLGLIDGAGIKSINFRAAFITKAAEEMADLIQALGGRRNTVYYLAGLGDLIATSLSEHSHNRRLGELLAQGLSFEDARKKMGVLPEGERTLRVAVALSEKYHTSMPVARGILNVIHG